MCVPCTLPPQADIHWLQPRFIGDPLPHDSVLRWTRGARQPADPAGAAVFEQAGSGSAGSGPTHAGVWSGRH